MQKKKGAPMIYSVLCAGECIQKEGGPKSCFYTGRLFK